MRIKKKKKSEYLLTPSGLWVRNFTDPHAPYVDINQLIKKSDYDVVLNNEIKNSKLSIEHIDNQDFIHPNCVIVSDGYDFKNKQEILSQLPKEITILGINGSLKKWDLKHKTAMNYYIVNNPHSECLTYLPTAHSYYPKCIASIRTHYKFLQKYKGYQYRYIPVSQKDYRAPTIDSTYQIDDYRNPICAAILLAFRFHVRKLLLFCCDDAFDIERPASEKLENGLWSYPQQKVAHDLIDANLHWLSNQEYEVQIKDHSSGLKYRYAEYISMGGILDFFKGEQ